MVHFGRQKMTLALIVIRRRFLLFFCHTLAACPLCKKHKKKHCKGHQIQGVCLFVFGPRRRRKADTKKQSKTQEKTNQNRPHIIKNGGLTNILQEMSQITEKSSGIRPGGRRGGARGRPHSAQNLAQRLLEVPPRPSEPHFRAPGSPQRPLAAPPGPSGPHFGSPGHHFGAILEAILGPLGIPNRSFSH